MLVTVSDREMDGQAPDFFVLVTMWTVVCLERGANDLRTVQLMPLSPHHLCNQ